MYIIVLLCLFLAYLTYGLARTICPEQGDYHYYPHSTVLPSGQRVAFDTATNGQYSIFGSLYPIDVVETYLHSNNVSITTEFGSLDLGPLFDGDLFGDCTPFFPPAFDRTDMDPCRLDHPYGK